QLTIGVEQAELARLIVKEAYAYGAKEVLVNWLDDAIARERLVNVDVELLEQVHPQRITEMNYLLERKASRLVVLSEDPGAYDGVDPEKLSRNARAL
ncbi:aminopeptidase, partial [Streptococcus suis]